MKQPQYINVFDNGKDTLISKNPVSGQYFVITPYETLRCCKGIAAIYMHHAEQPAAEAVLGRGSAATAPKVKLSTFAHYAASAMLFILMLTLFYIVFSAL